MSIIRICGPLPTCWCQQLTCDLASLYSLRQEEEINNSSRRLRFVSFSLVPTPTPFGRLASTYTAEIPVFTYDTLTFLAQPQHFRHCYGGMFGDPLHQKWNASMIHKAPDSRPALAYRVLLLPGLSVPPPFAPLLRSLDAFVSRMAAPAIMLSGCVSNRHAPTLAPTLEAPSVSRGPLMASLQRPLRYYCVCLLDALS